MSKFMNLVTNSLPNKKLNQPECLKVKTQDKNNYRLLNISFKYQIQNKLLVIVRYYIFLLNIYFNKPI